MRWLWLLVEICFGFSIWLMLLFGMRVVMDRVYGIIFPSKPD
jgi:hypothetical protein